MKTKLFSLSILFITQFSISQNNVTVKATDFVNSYVNVFNQSNNDFQFGFGYVVDKSRATFPSSSSISLSPNVQIWDDNDATPCSESFCSVWNPTWFSTAGNPNKIIDVLVYAQPANGTLDGKDLNFSGNISSFTLDSGYTIEAFIQVIQPVSPFSTFLLQKEILSSTGSFKVSVPSANLGTGNIIQYGFVMRGKIADPSNIGNFGSVIIDENSLSTNNPDLIQFGVFPNPADDYLHLNSKKAIEKIVIYSTSGSKVFSLNPQKNDVKIDISKLIPGIYIAKVTSNNFTQSLKFIKN